MNAFIHALHRMLGTGRLILCLAAIPAFLPVLAGTPPTISAIPDQSTREDVPTAAIAFTVSDAETAPEALTVVATTDNPSLIYPSGIVFGGSGSSRTVSLKPNANRFGSGHVRIRVYDGEGQTSSTLFTFTVDPVNDLPLISAIGEATILEGQASSPLSFSIRDMETPASSLTLVATTDNPTLLPVSRITFAGDAEARTVTLTPIAGRTGTGRVRVRVTDAGGGTRSVLFGYTVLPALSMTPIPNQVLQSGVPADPIPFSLGEPGTPPEAMSLVATTNNPTLFPISGIAFGGSGADRTVTLTPTPNLTGTGLIRVRVNSPSGRTTSSLFTVTVNAPISYGVIDFCTHGITYQALAWGGIVAQLTSAEIPSGGPTSQVVRITKPPQTEPWSAVMVSVGDQYTVGTLPFSASNTRMTAQIYAPEAGIPMNLSAQQFTGPGQYDRTVTARALTTRAGWQTLTFDFAQPVPESLPLNLEWAYNKLILTPDAGSAAGPERTYYLGPIRFLGASEPAAPPLTSPDSYTVLDFNAYGLTYTATPIGQMAGAGLTSTDVPPGCPYPQVAWITKLPGSEPWAGAILSVGNNLSIGSLPLEPSASQVTVLFFSPAPGIAVNLRAQDAADYTLATGTTAITSTTGWELLTFDFMNPDGGTHPIQPGFAYNQLVITPDFGVWAEREWTYYIGPITFLGATGPRTPPL